MDDREQELKDVPHWPTDKSTWPKGVQSISYNEVDALGTDAKGRALLARQARRNPPPT
jgi:hypothetical protein